MRRLLASSTILALATAGTIALAPASYSATADGAARLEPTRFALMTKGWGTRVRGGQIPAGSDTTAFRVIGCTNKAGIDRENHEAEVTVPGLGVLSGVKTRVWTSQHKGVTASTSRHTIGKLVIGDPSSGPGQLEINAIKSVSRAFHDKTGFHAETTTQIASIIFTAPGSEPQEAPIPTPDQPLEIPGLVTITIGKSIRKESSDRAKAKADVINIDLVASDSRARIAHTSAEINGGVFGGIFGGFASGTRAQAVDGNVTSGRTPFLVMPCQGTDGIVKTKDVANVNLDNQIVVGAVTTAEMGKQTKQRAFGYEQAKIANVNLGDGQLVIDLIKARANVERVGKKIVRNSDGTTIGGITANGEPQTFPDSDVIEIPGLVRLEQNIVKKFKSGIFVTALRLTLLDGSGAVINLGEVRLRIRPSGN